MPEDPESPAANEWMLPADLLLEIVARSDARTLVRCAAASRLLRRDILYPSFIHRVTRQGGIVPPCILAYLNSPDDDGADPQPPLSLVHPATTAAVSFLDDHISSYVSRFADDLLDEYYPVTSRGGLVLLRRRHHISNKLSNLCVYDLITGQRNFLSDPPDTDLNSTQRYVLFTNADGIGCSFMLLFAELDFTADNIQVQTTTSTCGTWAPAAILHKSSYFLKFAMLHDAVVLHGGVIHWMVRNTHEIVSYNICTMEQGTIRPPVLAASFKGLLCLGSYYSNDRQKLLRLLGF
jgi:hypothetical protein